MQPSQEADVTNTPRIRLLPFRKVLDLIPYSRATIYRRVHAGTFPRPVKLGPSRIAWREDEVLAWLDAQPRALE
jgi:prophage regulatory protein